MPKRKRLKEPKNFEQLVRHKTLRFFKLQLIADRLNDLPRYREESVSATDLDERKWKAALADGWGLAKEILSLQSLKEQAARFTLEAGSHSVFQQVTMEKVTVRKTTTLEPVPSCALPKTSRGNVLNQLWEAYFHDHGWERLKRCAKCETWFVDATDKKTKVYCSDKCRDRFWNRGRRQQEHTHQKKAEG